jgi:C4-dicarboxylate-specific signal transduction histidine kinase
MRQPLAVVAALLGLLIVLLIQSRSPDLAVGEEMQRALLGYQLYDAELTRDVLTARAGLEANYEALASDRRNLARTLDEIVRRGTAGSEQWKTGLQRPLEDLKKAHDEKRAWVEHFKAKNALLRNSWMYLTFAGPLLHIPDEQKPFAADFGRFSYALQRFAQSPDPESAAEMQHVLDRLAVAPGFTPEVGTLVAHGRLIINLMPETDRLVRQVVDAQTALRAHDVQAALAQHTRTAEGRAQVFRLLLFAVSVLMLAYVVYQLARLRAGALNLRHANADLQREMAERTRATEALRVKELQLIQADRMKILGQQVSSVVHEIGNPLQSLLMNSSRVAASCSDMLTLLDQSDRAMDATVGGLPYRSARTELPEQTHEMQEAAGRIAQFVADLKHFYGPTSQGVSIAFSVNDVVRRAERLLRHQINQATSNWRTHLAADLPAARGEPRRFEQVVVNLIVNALEALPDRSRAVTVSTSWDPQGARQVLQVEDEGIGIAEEDLARIRSPFFTTKQASGGTGLGLAITTTLLDDMGGQLSIESYPGRGTRATVEIGCAGHGGPAPV